MSGGDCQAIPVTVIRTGRLELEVLDLERIDALLATPTGWPDDDVDHLRRWRGLAVDDGGSSAWRARSVTTRDGTIVGHVGFHGRPVPLDEALADPTFVGIIDPSDSGAVEVGYTIFESFRRRGYAVEAVAALLRWAESTGQVGAVIACVEPRNAASRAVLDRLGGFTRIGTCSDDGTDELVFRRNLT